MTNRDHGPGSLAIRALLDTNVLGSGLIGRPRELSVPGEILRRWLVGQFSLVISEPILYELQYSVFMSAYFQQRLSPERMVGLLKLHHEESIIADLTIQVTGKSPDPDDDHVLAAALSSGVD